MQEVDKKPLQKLRLGRNKATYFRLKFEGFLNQGAKDSPLLNL